MQTYIENTMVSPGRDCPSDGAFSFSVDNFLYLMLAVYYTFVRLLQLTDAF